MKNEKLIDINLPQYVQQEGYDVPWSSFTANDWSLEPPAVDELMQKIQTIGVPLADFAGGKPLYGLKTGLNEAFLIDVLTKEKIIQSDFNSTQILKPYLRSQDVKQWDADYHGLWIILPTTDININDYPGVKNHLEQYHSQLESRAGNQLWWQLQARPAYHTQFKETKIIWQDITWKPSFCFDENGLIINDLCFTLVSDDKWILAVLNSPIIWYWLWRNTLHGKDEVLRLKNIYTQHIPIAPPTDEIRSQVEPIATRLIEITKTNQEASREVLDWLRVEQNIAKLGQKLEDFASLDCDQFVQEVKTRKPKGSSFSPKALKEVREVYNDYAPHIQTRRAEALMLEMRLSDLVNQAYGLTPEEIDLMWKTAPPRMPIPKPTCKTPFLI